MDISLQEISVIRRGEVDAGPAATLQRSAQCSSPTNARYAIMSSSFELPPDIRTVLTGKRQLHPDTVVLVEMVMEELIEVAAGVGRDYDEAEGDYANLAGLMCSGRTRNRVAR